MGMNVSIGVAGRVVRFALGRPRGPGADAVRPAPERFVW